MEDYLKSGRLNLISNKIKLKKLRCTTKFLFSFKLPNFLIMRY